MTYTIERFGVTYEVEPYDDDGEIFAVIHSAELRRAMRGTA